MKPAATPKVSDDDLKRGRENLDPDKLIEVPEKVMNWIKYPGNVKIIQGEAKEAFGKMREILESKKTPKEKQDAISKVQEGVTDNLTHAVANIFKALLGIEEGKGTAAIEKVSKAYDFLENKDEQDDDKYVDLAIEAQANILNDSDLDKETRETINQAFSSAFLIDEKERDKQEEKKKKNMVPAAVSPTEADATPKKKPMSLSSEQIAEKAWASYKNTCALGKSSARFAVAAGLFFVPGVGPGLALGFCALSTVEKSEDLINDLAAKTVIAAGLFLIPPPFGPALAITYCLWGADKDKNKKEPEKPIAKYGTPEFDAHMKEKAELQKKIAAAKKDSSAPQVPNTNAGKEAVKVEMEVNKDLNQVQNALDSRKEALVKNQDVKNITETLAKNRNLTSGNTKEGEGSNIPITVFNKINNPAGRS